MQWYSLKGGRAARKNGSGASIRTRAEAVAPVGEAGASDRFHLTPAAESVRIS